jgi:MFS family permease
LAFFIAFFNQLSGINAILYFAPRIFKLTGLDQSAAMLQSVGIGVTNLVFTFVGLWLIDKLGRRTLLYIGSFGYIASLALCAFAFFAFSAQFNVAAKAIAVQEIIVKIDAAEGKTALAEEDMVAKMELAEEYLLAKTELVEAAASEKYDGDAVMVAEADDIPTVLAIASKARELASTSARSGGITVLLCIFAFIAAHAIGQGAVIWVFISEIFPNRNRASGQALGSFTHWIFAALLTLFFPKMMETFAPGTVFSFFCFMMVLQLVWVKLKVPETKGVSLEAMQKKLGIE